MNDVLRNEIIKSAYNCANTINHKGYKLISDGVQEFIVNDNPKDSSIIYRLSKSDLNFKLNFFNLSNAIYQDGKAILLMIKTVRGIYVYPYHKYYSIRPHELFNGYGMLYANDKYYIEKDYKLINVFEKDFKQAQDIKNSYLSNDFLSLSEQEQYELISVAKANAVLLMINHDKHIVWKGDNYEL